MYSGLGLGFDNEIFFGKNNSFGFFWLVVSMKIRPHLMMIYQQKDFEKIYFFQNLENSYSSCQLLTLWIFEIYLFYLKKGLKTCFSLNINSFINGLNLRVQILIVDIQLSLNRKLKAFLKIFNHSIFIKGCHKIEFLKDYL